ncbi:hypothetical protein CALCODRAFT_490805 [Calocera cornea HHB12733]|uniref:Uncharacterized protein n=1 Tax=Calocera cornea HHB12733 TaxID=1353952 RepID=A0A165JIE0_9BASI|nr:hypothetical protein CALCODRAFT_490805 [Calocera cornea HHB12733]
MLELDDSKPVGYQYGNEDYFIQRGKPEHETEWMYTYDFDNNAMCVNSGPTFNMDNMPPPDRSATRYHPARPSNPEIRTNEVVQATERRRQMERCSNGPSPPPNMKNRNQKTTITAVGRFGIPNQAVSCGLCCSQ